MSVLEKLLEDIQQQIEALRGDGMTPGAIKMTESTWQNLCQEVGGILQAAGSPIGKRTICGVRVMTDPAMKPGAARVYMEWE